MVRNGCPTLGCYVKLKHVDTNRMTAEPPHKMWDVYECSECKSKFVKEYFLIPYE